MYERRLIRDFVQSQRDHPEWPVAISEGDSWFSYSDVIGRLDERPGGQRPWALLRLEKAGDEMLTILSGAQRARLRGYFSRWPIDALLFSGGGNDIIGADLLPLLRPFVVGMEVRDLVAFSRFERRLRQIQDCYRELLDLLADAGRSASVFVNSYDYVIPSGRGAELFGVIEVAGPWLLPAFDQRGIPPSHHAGVIQLLIDGFAAAIDAVAAEPRGFGRLVRVETRGALGAGDWKDEIHPDRGGAVKVAQRFESALQSAGM